MIRNPTPFALVFSALVYMPPTANPQEIPYTRFVLPNGLQVILHTDPRLPLVSTNLWYYVGSKDEAPGRSGFAHLFEHLMFMGTEKVPYPQFDVIMEKSGGSNNATTSQDRTNYFETGPRELLDTFLMLEADRMASLGDSMTKEKLESQRQVVRNERRQSYENRPYGKAYLEVPNRLYPPGHPYHHPVIGSHEDLESATVEDVKDFFKRFYFPGNASLVIAGDFDPQEARLLVEKHFGALGSSPGASHVKEAKQPKLEGTVRATLEDSVELPLSLFVWHSSALYKSGDAEMDILANILGGGKSSRLYRRLVYERELAQEIEVQQDSNYLGSEFYIHAYLRPEASQDELEEEIDREIERLKKEGPTAREVERAKNKIETSFWKGQEGLGERADRLNRYQFYFDDPGALSQDRARYVAVTPCSVQKWAQKTLSPDSRLILRIVARK